MKTKVLKNLLKISITNYKIFKYKKNNYSKYFDSIEGRARFRGETIGVDYAEAFIVVKQIET